MKNILTIALFSLLIFSCQQVSKDGNGTESQEQQASTSQKSELPMVDITRVPSMTKEELRIARNTIYAKYGRVFKSADLKAHFAKQPWYKENPRFKESDLKEGDQRIVNMIRLWENKTEVLWREKLDMSGNGSFEYCYVLYNNKTNKFALIINEYSQEYEHYWGPLEEEAPPKEWAKINIEAVDIIPDDGRQEIHISQRFRDWEDPGTENIIATFDSEMHVTKLSSTDYDGGILTFANGEVTMQVSHCPEHTRDYHLEKGKLVQIDEHISPPPPGGCAACFTGEMLIATSITSSKAIRELKKGDEVLSYNTETNALEMTTVLRVLEIHHDVLFKLSIDGQVLELTDDHPIYCPDKGWSSLAPEKTTARYANYGHVAQLQKGDAVQLANGNLARIESIERMDHGQTTYTVESLENGQSIIVNGIVAGTERSIKSVPVAM